MSDPLREMFGLPPGATGADLALQWLGRGLRAAGREAWRNQVVQHSRLFEFGNGLVSAGGACVQERQDALDAHVDRLFSRPKRRIGLRRTPTAEQLVCDMAGEAHAVLENLRQRGVKFCTGQIGDTLTVEVVLHG